MIVPLLKKGDVCSFFRLLLPFQYLGLMKPEFEEETLETLFPKASIVIFNRYWGNDIIDLLKAKKRYGFSIVADIDDFWELYPNHVAYKGWQEWDMAQRTKESLMNADYVITTTSRLADVVRPLNKNIEVIPNALPFDYGQFSTKEYVADRIRFILAGGKTHLHDIKQIENCLKKLGRKNRGQYETVLAGYDDTDKDGVWSKIEAAVVKGNYIEFHRRINRLPLESYMDAYNQGDVVLAPLESNYFNQFKSNLKILEAGCKNMPIITSNYPPYSDESTDLVMKASSTNEWYDHMTYVIKNPTFVKERGIALGQYVRQHYDLRKVNELRTQLFSYLQNK